ncbi:hypothetical protein Zm00014a_043766 [Zea mays]|jgi:hypothetical protein|uniref:Uncharacterized protein n=1 Tax=Zea mays TaxID=4577 RepID=A0A3L6FQC6_MAIZE|nr:hypothetical protein Zm00014a_043766 [Zea mays]
MVPRLFGSRAGAGATRRTTRWGTRTSAWRSSRAQRKRRGASCGGVTGFANLLSVSSGDDEDAVVELAEADEPWRKQKKRHHWKQRKRQRKEATAAAAAAVDEEEKEVSLRL